MVPRSKYIKRLSVRRDSALGLRGVCTGMATPTAGSPPPSTVFSVDDSWGLQTEGTEPEAALPKFHKSMMEAVANICQQHGGPLQCLRRTFSTEEKRKSFSEWLYQSFPPLPTESYHFTVDLPQTTEEEKSRVGAFRLHVGAFSFLPAASLKLPLGGDVANKLAEEIMLDGFVTSGEPLLVTLPEQLRNSALAPPWRPDDPRSQVLMAQSVGYAKGQARMGTLLAMLGLCFEDSVQATSLFQWHPKFARSIQNIYCLCMSYQTKRDELLANFKLSARGSIRKPPNAITWVHSLDVLAKATPRRKQKQQANTKHAQGIL